MASPGFSGVKKRRNNEFYTEKIDVFYDFVLNDFLTTEKLFFYERGAGNPGITSETTWESRVRRPGSLE